MCDVLTLASFDEDLIPVIAMAIGGGIWLIWIVFGTIRRIAQTAAKERTKREIAAYIAEGSMTPADGERILKADKFERN